MKIIFSKLSCERASCVRNLILGYVLVIWGASSSLTLISHDFGVPVLNLEYRYLRGSEGNGLWGPLMASGCALAGFYGYFRVPGG
jgi:hypothetical protein